MTIEEALKKYNIGDFVMTKYGYVEITDYEIVEDHNGEKTCYWLVYDKKLDSHLVVELKDFIESDEVNKKEEQKISRLDEFNKISELDILNSKIKDYIKRNLTVKLERQIPPKYSDSTRKYLVAKLYLEGELFSTSNIIEFHGDDLV